MHQLPQGALRTVRKGPKVTLSELVGVLARVPVPMSLQREDFRTRLTEGHGLSVAEFVRGPPRADPGIGSAAVIIWPYGAGRFDSWRAQ